MAITTATVDAFLDRVAGDPDFMDRVAADPIGTATAEGWDVSLADLREFLDAPGASEEQLVESLQERMSHSAKC